MPTFNLIDEPWVPVRLLDGTRMELGFLELFLQAHDLMEVRDESPLVTAALHRLLIVLGHRITDGPKTEKHWGELWKAKRFDEKAVRVYFQRWHDRFDLFHEKHPFWQVAGFSIVDSKGAEQPPKSLNNLFHEDATGNNPTLFDHKHDGLPYKIAPALSARKLVAFQYYAIGGGKGATSNRFGEHPYLAHGSMVGEITSLLNGYSLFQTVLLNMLSHSHWPVSQSGDKDKPVWEQNDVPEVKKTRTPLGYLDYSTLSSRIVRLIPDSQGNAIGFHFAQSSGLSKDLSIRAPHAPHRLHHERGLIPITLDPARALWRDSYALFIQALDDEKKADPRPLPLFQLDRIWEDYIGEDTDLFHCSVLGIASDKAKLLLWRHEEWPVSKRLNQDRNASSQLYGGLEKAEETGSEVNRVLYRLALYSVSGHSDKNPQDSEKKNARTLAERSTFWSRMEPLFHGFLRDLVEDPEQASMEWQKHCRSQALNAFEETATLLVGTTASDLRELVKARSSLLIGLSKVFPHLTENKNESEGENQ